MNLKIKHNIARTSKKETINIETMIKKLLKLGIIVKAINLDEEWTMLEKEMPQSFRLK